MVFRMDVLNRFWVPEVGTNLKRLRVNGFAGPTFLTRSQVRCRDDIIQPHLIWARLWIQEARSSTDVVDREVICNEEKK